MSIRGTTPRNRRNRRSDTTGVAPIRPAAMDLPGPLRFLSNPKLFMAFALVAGATMVAGLGAGALRGGTSGGSGTQQMNEAPDVPISNQTQSPDVLATAQPAVQRFTDPPPLTIDVTKTYTATIQTPKGAITMELYPSAAPQAVNAFIFLAGQGYYNNTPFMQLTKDQSGSKFYTQAGDPTHTGLGTPGFSIKKEQTSLPFARGSVGMGGSASNSNGGQFFISFGDYPALDGKYTIFGKVVAGLDVLDNLTLLDLSTGTVGPTGDVIQSVTVSP